MCENISRKLATVVVQPHQAAENLKMEGLFSIYGHLPGRGVTHNWNSHCCWALSQTNFSTTVLGRIDGPTSVETIIMEAETTHHYQIHARDEH